MLFCAFVEPVLAESWLNQVGERFCELVIGPLSSGSSHISDCKSEVRTVLNSGADKQTDLIWGLCQKAPDYRYAKKATNPKVRCFTEAYSLGYL